MTRQNILTEVEWHDPEMQRLRTRGQRTAYGELLHRTQDRVVLLGLLEEIAIRGGQERDTQTQDAREDK